MKWKDVSQELRDSHSKLLLEHGIPLPDDEDEMVVFPVKAGTYRKGDIIEANTTT